VDHVAAVTVVWHPDTREVALDALGGAERPLRAEVERVASALGAVWGL
jgi:hypothetical protein